MNGMKLRATGRALPSVALSNDDMCKFVDTNDEWITTRTGIRQRYHCTGEENTTTLAIAAAKQALERSGIAKEELGCLIVATSTAVYAMPSLSCLVHQALELPEGIPVMDVGAACAGYLYALEVARGLLVTQEKRYAMVVGAEQLSAVTDMTDRGTCVLLGDGAGAAVYELEPEMEYVSTQGSRGSMAINVAGPKREGYLHMDGQDVFRFATTILPQCANELLEKSGLTIDDVDWIVCHQANSRILASSARRLGAPLEKFYMNLDRVGNTCAASIPLCLDEMMEQDLLKEGQRIMMIGFGGGLTWAGAMMKV